ncbi:MAG TPA: hypothetical protein ENI79_03850 [Rhodospirillales bacterium]|nr:hypothetical protein [Rhodospirillales bacterium]
MAMDVSKARHSGPDTPEAARISYALRKMQENGVAKPTIDSNNINGLLETALPNPHEQADNLILYMGRSTSDNPGNPFNIKLETVASIIGGLNSSDVSYAIYEMVQQDFIRARGSGQILLTLDGWGRYDELSKSSIDSRQAFMAMPFGKDTLDKIFQKHWAPAVTSAGFNLVRLDTRERAGLIDDRLRVEIRRSRFLIAEITGQNQGAYWEAGFAAGLDRPVIYICEKNEFKKTHFDTNHNLTILWTEDTLKDAAERLTACIRETLPAEANLGGD